MRGRAPADGRSSRIQNAIVHKPAAQSKQSEKNLKKIYKSGKTKPRAFSDLRALSVILPHGNEHVEGMNAAPP
jgi:hypothetical protein